VHRVCDVLAKGNFRVLRGLADTEGVVGLEFDPREHCGVWPGSIAVGADGHRGMVA